MDRRLRTFARMQSTQEQPAPSSDPDPAHPEPAENRPNPGDPGPDVPAPRTPTDPLCDPRLPLTNPPPRGV